MTPRARTLVAAGIFLAAAGCTAVGLGRLSIDSGLDSLLPSGDPVVAAQADMAKQFGEDPIVVLIEGAGDPLSAKRLPELLQLEGQLSQLPDVVATYGPATTLNQTVLRIKQMLADLSGQRDALQQAHRTRALAAFDKRYGALIVKAMPAGLPTLRNPGFVRTVVIDPSTGDPRPRWRQYLPSADSVAVYLRPRAGLDQAGTESLVAAVRSAVDKSAIATKTNVTIAGAPVVSANLASRVGGEVPRLAITAFLVAAGVLLLVPWTRRRRDRLAPLLVMGAATAGTLSMFGWLDKPLSIGAATFLPIILGIGSYYPVYLARTSHRRVVLAVATSSCLAFTGLLLSPLPFVGELGLAVPVGLAQVVATSLLIAWARPTREGVDVADIADRRARALRIPPVIAAVLLVAVASGAALGWTDLKSAPLKTDPQELLAGLPALDDATHVQDLLGYSGEIDVRLVGPDVLTPAVLKWSQQAQEDIVTRMGDRVHPVLTIGDLLSFLGSGPSNEQVLAGVAALPPYIATAVLSSDADQALMSYGVSWDDVAADPHLMTQLEALLPPPPNGYRVVVSGLPVAAQRGYALVSAERYGPSAIALGAAALALVVLLPRRRDAVLAVVAAAIAAGLNVALMLALVGSLNPLTLPLGALTAAVGAEFTVLLLAAGRAADGGMRRAVLLAALLSLGGYGVLLTSSLPALRELGLALTASVALSALVAVVLTNVRFGRRGEGVDRASAVEASREPHSDPSVGRANTDRLQPLGGSR